jgi:hypothetical protein
MTRFVPFLLIMTAFFCSCNAPVGGKRPSIEVLEVKPLEVREFQDSILFRIRYQDGDGDLGENNSDAENLFLTDSRNGVRYGYRIPQILPDSLLPSGLTGELTFSLPATILTDSSAAQTFAFSLQAVDRAGHKSRKVWTPEVTVTK